jgi:hypothetical protein
VWFSLRSRPSTACPFPSVAQEEKAAVGEVFNSAISCLQEADRTLPFIQAMLPMLQAGIAMHHSGALRFLCLLRLPRTALATVQRGGIA